MEKRISQQEIADFLNISQKTYSNIESGISHIRINHFYILSQYLNIDICQFFDIKKEKRIIANPSIIGKNDHLFNLIQSYHENLRRQEKEITLLTNRLSRLKKKHKKTP